MADLIALDNSRERPPKESGSHKKFGGGSRRHIFTQLLYISIITYLLVESNINLSMFVSSNRWQFYKYFSI